MAETVEKVEVAVEETKVEETPVEEPKVEEQPAEQPAEEKKEEVVEEPKQEEEKKEEVKEEPKVEETPAEQPAEEKKEEVKEETPVEEPKEEIKEEVKEEPKQEEEKKEETPVEQPKEEVKEEEKKEEEHLPEPVESAANDTKVEEVKEEKKEESKEQTPIKMKLIIVGESSVGKTSCMSRYVDGKFDEQTKATIGVGVGKKEVDVDDKKVLLQIWDTAGQERFATLSTGYFRNAHGAIIMYDVTNKDSFDNIANWIEQCNKSEEKRVVCIVGNKIDIEERIITKEDAEKKAEELKLKYFEVSAKSGEGFDALFDYLLKEIIAQDIIKPEEEGVDVAQTGATKKGGCC